MAATSGRQPRRARFSLSGWGLRHAQVLFATLGQLARDPVSTVLTAAVIGIALALPAGLHAFLDNVRAVTADWRGEARIAVFMRAGVGVAEAERFGATFRALPEVASVRIISPAEALAEYRELTGLGDALEGLEADNPLPAVVEIDARAGTGSTARMAALARRARARAEVAEVQFDQRWLERLGALVELARRGATVLAVVLGLGVVFVVGNTIRLGIDRRRDEIEIAKLFGATDRFVRRPFLYAGFVQGVLGGLIASALVAAAFLALGGPVGRLAALYDAGYTLRGLGGAGVGALVGGGAVLGYLGSWLAVARHLKNIQPR